MPNSEHSLCKPTPEPYSYFIKIITTTQICHKSNIIKLSKNPTYNTPKPLILHQNQNFNKSPIQHHHTTLSYISNHHNFTTQLKSTTKFHTIFNLMYLVNHKLRISKLNHDDQGFYLSFLSLSLLDERNGGNMVSTFIFST